MRTREEIVFPNNIKQFRVRKNLTQQQLGRMMTPPIGESAISKIESGERRLTNLQLGDIAQILGCQPADLPVVKARDAIPARNWQKAQQAVVEASIASGAAATGYVLAQLRKKCGKTMQQVASAIGMTLSVYHRVEMASRVIHSAEIDAVSRFYDMRAEEMITLFERRSQEIQEQLHQGIPAEQLLPRVPRSLLKDDSKWRRLGALERYVLNHGVRHVPSVGDDDRTLPVYGVMKTHEDGKHRFVIDRTATTDYVSMQELCQADEECFCVRNFSPRLGFLMRPGSIALVDPRTPVALGDLAFVVRKDGSADAGIVIGDGIGPLSIKMYNPEELVPIANGQIAEVFRIKMLVLA